MHTRNRLLSLLVALAALVAACGGSAATETTEPTPDATTGDVDDPAETEQDDAATGEDLVSRHPDSEADAEERWCEPPSQRCQKELWGDSESRPTRGIRR